MSTRRNPNAGAPSHPDVVGGCSSITTEALPGTAKQARVVIALEYFTNWGHDILDGEALGKELAGKIKKFLKDNGAALHFIRKPGRDGQERVERPKRALYIAWADGRSGTSTEEPTDPVLEYMEVAGPESILDLDLTTPGHTPGATVMSNPILLVCTHGKRDTCCAVFGRPLADKLATIYPANVWESSHTKGHRFAPSMILLPSNYSYGRVTEDQGAALLDAAASGRLSLDANRGRGVWDVIGQVAELAAAQHMVDAGEPVAPAQLQVSEPEKASKKADHAVRLVHDPRGGVTYEVRLEKRHTGTAVSSCGDTPKDAYGWVAESVEPHTSA